MPRDAESLKIALWAESGDRTEPENLSTPIDRDVGYTAAAYGGRLVREEVNQDRRERSGAALDSIQFGIPPYSADVDYPADEGVVQRQVGGVVGIYTNNADAGPDSTVVDPATSGQTTWDRVSGAVTTPGQVSGVTATAGNTVADLEWDAPILGGAPVTRFDIRWKPTSRSSWQSADIRAGDKATNWRATSLTNSTEYEFQVRAVTAEGSGPWSTTGVTATPGPGSPGRVATPAAIAGDTQVRLLWGQPDLNGGSLVRYEVQWAGPSQSFGSTRQQNASGTTSTVTGLTNGDAYRFRVRVRTQVSGAWSSPDATATPIASFQRFTASNANFAWPYPLATRARIVLKGGDGSDGGGGGGGSGGNSGGSSDGALGTGGGSGGRGGTSSTRPAGGGGAGGDLGARGTASSITVSGTTYTADGGIGGPGGGGGYGGRAGITVGGVGDDYEGGGGGGAGQGRSGTGADGGNGGDSNHLSGRIYGDGGVGIAGGGSGGGRRTHNLSTHVLREPEEGFFGQGGSGGSGGVRGFGNTLDGTSGTAGGAGEEGLTTVTTLTGLSLGDAFTIVVGPGGAGGDGGAGAGNASSGSDGSAGDGGWVEVTPLY